MHGNQMLCAKFVAQLHNLPESEGHITAFTSFGRTIFLGTTLGTILAYRVSVKPISEKHIFTTLTHKKCLIDKKKVTRVHHSPSHDLLFALCGKRVFVMNSRSLDDARVLVEGVSDFWVSRNPDASRTVHTLTCAMHNKKEVLVLELDASQGARPEEAHTLILPEPVQQVVEFNGIVCLGMRREYSMLSVSDGDSKSLLALTGNATPMLSIGGSDVFMRLGDTLFVVSMRTMPTTGNVLKTTIRFPEEPRALVYAHPFLFGFCKSYCNVYSWYDGDIIEELPMEDCCFASANVVDNTVYCASKSKIWLIRTVPLEHQLEQLVLRNKIDNAFDLLRSQPVPLQVFVGQKLPTDSHATEATSAASQLTASARVDTGGALNLSKSFDLEANLNVMVGFAHLYSNATSEAIGHFGSFVDVREPILHLPDLLPSRRSKSQLNARVRSLLSASLKEASPEESPVARSVGDARSSLLALTCHQEDAESDFERVFWSGFRPRHPHSRLWSHYYLDESSQDSTPVSPSPALTGGFPSGTCGSISTPSASVAREVLISAWASSFYKTGSVVSPGDTRRLFDAHSLLPSHPSSGHANVALSLEEYLELSEDRLKEELVRWLSSRLETSPPTQRRSAEYALTVLYLQAGDRRSLYSLLSRSEFIQFADVWELLSSPLARIVNAQGDSCPADYLFGGSLLTSYNSSDIPGGWRYHDLLSRVLGFHVSHGEWRLLLLVLQRQLGFFPESANAPTAISCLFDEYLSFRPLSLTVRACFAEVSHGDSVGTSFQSAFSLSSAHHTPQGVSRKTLCADKGRQWPLLLRDYLEAGRRLYVPTHQWNTVIGDTHVYPESMILSLDALPLKSDFTDVFFTVNRDSSSEIFFAIESGDHRYVGETLQAQHERHLCDLAGAFSASASPPCSGRTSCLFTTDKEGNNPFHILFALLLRACSGGSRAVDVLKSSDANGSLPSTDFAETIGTQRDALRRAKQMASLNKVLGDKMPSAGNKSLASSPVDLGAHRLGKDLPPLSNVISIDSALAILSVLLSHGCSEVCTLGSRSLEPRATFDEKLDHTHSAFQESLGCALTNPSSLLLLIASNDFGVTPLQIVEAFPTSCGAENAEDSHGADRRFGRDPNSHTFELVVSFILAQLRVLTVPE